MCIYIYAYISAQPIAALQKIPPEQAAPVSTEKDAKDARAFSIQRLPRHGTWHARRR